MLSQGTAKKVTIYLNEDTRYHTRSLHEAVLEFLMHKGVAGATATRALAGFGAHRVLHTPRIEALAEHLPIRIEFIETPDRVDELLPALAEMVTDGLIEVQDTNVMKIANQEKRAPQAEPRPPHERRTGKAKMMHIYLGEADRYEGRPLYEAIVARLHSMDIAGATVYKGVLGYGAKGHTHKQNFWHVSRDLPVMISVVESDEKIGAAAAAVEEMLDDGLIAISDVDIVRLLRPLPHPAGDL